MKKLFLAIVLLFAFNMQAQSELVTVFYEDLLEATPQTKYVELGEWSQIDSVGLTIVGTGEIDIDSVDVYPGWTSSSAGAYYGTTAYTFLTTVNTAASTKFWNNATGSTATAGSATVLTSAVMRHSINVLKVIVQPTDGSVTGNTVYCVFKIWGTPLGGD